MKCKENNSRITVQLEFLASYLTTLFMTLLSIKYLFIVHTVGQMPP